MKRNKPAQLPVEKVSKIGITKKSHEETKKRRKMAEKSRKLNRKK
jgi:hypothetical protein